MTPTAELDAYEMRGEIRHADATAARARIQIDELRAATLGTIVALAHQHSLPIPCDIGGREGATGRSLWMHVETDQAVDDWARVLGLRRPYNNETKDGGYWRGADRVGKAVWLAWDLVHVVCFPADRIPSAAQVAAAALSPDAEVAS